MSITESFVEQITALADEYEIVSKRKLELELQLSVIREAFNKAMRANGEAKLPRKPRSDIGVPRKRADGEGLGPIKDSDGNVVAEDFGSPSTAA
jgi:hypothetical protein